ncbi:MAG: TIGR00341 family protein [Vulcanimicrobiota bacterium]
MGKELDSKIDESKENLEEKDTENEPREDRKNPARLLKILKDKIKIFFGQFILDEEDKRRVYFEVDSNSIGTKEYYGLVIVSAIIAALGLLNNSVAVIIGAMIIAPLMNPTMGIAMGIVRGDVILITRSLKTLFIGVFVGIFVCFLTALFFPVVDVNSIGEIINRTRPNLLDLSIGLAAGIGGAYALTQKKIASSLPGVAIAVALMPPLAVTGIGIKLGNAPIALGSFILCISNLAAINLSAILIFSLAGFSQRRSSETMADFRKQFLLSFLLVIVMVAPTTSIYLKTLRQQIIEKKITQIISTQLSSVDEEASIRGKPKWNQRKTTIQKDSQQVETKVTDVEVTIYTPKFPDEVFTFQLRAMLEEAIMTPVNVTLRFVPTIEYTNRGFILPKTEDEIEESKKIQNIKE